MQSNINILKVSGFILVIVILSSINVFADNTTFIDVSSSDWFYSHVESLTSQGVISGYPDDTFKPSNNISVAEFTKLTVVSAVYGVHVENGKEYWASNYFDIARQKGIIQSKDFDVLTRPIIRAEMAKMVVRALSDFKFPKDLVGNFNDMGNCPEMYRNYIAQAEYCKIILGYPDGSFQWQKRATRAEAVAIIQRLINIKYNNKS